MSNAEINRELAALKRMFNLGLRQTPPKVHQKPYIPMLQEQNARKGFFEHFECERLRATLPQTYRAVVTFAYYSGWRKQEILGLSWECIDLQAQMARLDPGTTEDKDGQVMYLKGEMLDTLSAL